MKYLPLADKAREEMLAEIGVSGIEDLFASIPEELRFRGTLDIPKGQSEIEIRRFFQSMARKNHTFESRFLGAGSYHHFIPVVVDHLSSRQEFLTSYTPYQPEVSQGHLQALFEYQTLICMLTGMEVSNASMYDGATATAEALLMALRLQRKRKRLLLSRALHPNYLKVSHTYLSNLDLQVDYVDMDGDATCLKDLQAKLGPDVAAVAVGYPNFLGVVEPLEQIADMVHRSGALLISSTSEALSLALLKAPGECQVDMAVGEAQSFGVGQQFGGPHLGFFTCRDKDKRQMPGRLCGQTVDRTGKRGFVLTLNAREQHIRRAKATSNICSNQGLCALRSVIYLSALGKKGLRELAVQNHSKAVYLHGALQKAKGIEVSQRPFFNEFVVTLPVPASKAVETLAEQQILAGLDLGRISASRPNQLLVAVTEMNTAPEMDQLVAALEGLA